MTLILDYEMMLDRHFHELKLTPMFERMKRTVEGSPWHREANVLVHTEMVVAEYKRLVRQLDPSHVWTRQDYIGGMACVFHDTGKPPAEIEKYSETRGKYRAYHGHELLSAHMWQDWAAQRGASFSANEIFQIMWMIEHHMPWNVEDETKLTQLGLTADHLGFNVYTNALVADQFGRTSDDASVHHSRTLNWIKEFIRLTAMTEKPEIDPTKPFAIMPIAPSGAGKSTYLKHLREKRERNIEVFSLDLLRHEFYDATDYAKAYEGSVKDKSFESRANARFHKVAKDAIASGCDLYIDNTNLSAKRRKWYLNIVRKLGFQTRAVLMPVSLDVLLSRQNTRGDKNVPAAAVRQQYMSLQTPCIGEFDEIVVCDHNIRKHP